MTQGISVLIYTRNEQQDLPGCLESLAWCDDIHIYDSMSTDGTLDIARRYGASVTQRSYPDNRVAFGGDEAAHRNWGLDNIAFKYEWIYHSDADERVTPELVLAMQNAVLLPNGHSAFRVRRRDHFLGQWLKHVTPSPFNIRLFKAGQVRYQRLTNPVTIVDGSVGNLEAHFNHYPFSKGMRHWIDKHNQYSDFEARQIVQNKRGAARLDLKKVFFEPDQNLRRVQQKELYYRLPCRPLVMFILLYVVKRGFLDGRAGLRYAMLRAMYEYMIVVKTQDLLEQSAHDEDTRA